MLSQVDVSLRREGTSQSITLMESPTDEPVQYDIGDLKKAAFDDLRGQLCPENIFVELFSSFTAL